MAESYTGEAYCVKCKEKREFTGHVEETNGRRFAKGICPVCGTKVTRILGSIEGRKFQVSGHTDNVPTGKNSRFKSNWELSSQRALTVLDLMIKEGMDARRLSAAGYADVLPVGSNDTDDGKRQNRRIEIVLQPNIEDLPGIDDKQ